jgi:hypothetical protein
MKKYLLVVIVTVLSLRSNAQLDMLEPETGYFSGLNHQDSYYPIVKKVLFDSLQYNTDIRIVVMPSFSPEYLISIDTRENGKSYLTYRIAKQQIWNWPKPKNDQIECQKYIIEFDNIFAKKLHELFVLAISKARFIPPPKGDTFEVQGVDGTNYIFLTFVNGNGLIGGKTWSPRSEKMSGLVVLTEWLNDCARTGTVQNQDKMLIKVNDLIDKFKNE